MEWLDIGEPGGNRVHRAAAWIEYRQEANEEEAQYGTDSSDEAPRIEGAEARTIHDELFLKNLDLLVSKMHKLRLRMNDEDRVSILEARTSGRLADMNLIDLVQALGPARKTARITIRPDHCAERRLVMYLCHGSIVFAESGELTGAAAVYEGLSWAHGTWSVEPVEAEDIPPPNNEFSNESILMEGCRLLDERAKAENLL